MRECVQKNRNLLKIKIVTDTCLLQEKNNNIKFIGKINCVQLK